MNIAQPAGFLREDPEIFRTSRTVAKHQARLEHVRRPHCVTSTKFPGNIIALVATRLCFPEAVFMCLSYRTQGAGVIANELVSVGPRLLSLLSIFSPLNKALVLLYAQVFDCLYRRSFVVISIY